MRAAWSLMLDAMRHEQETLLPPEVWFYGAELLRTLAKVEISPDTDRESKREVLAEFCAGVRGDLAEIPLDSEAHPWLRRVHAFYKEVSA